MDVTNRQIQAGRWSNGLFDCLSDPISCLEMWCCFHGQVSAQYGMLTQGKAGVELLCCAGMCLVDSCWTFGLAACLVNCKNRSEIRRRFGIVGSDMEDFLVSSCCLCCAGSQQYREMSCRGTWPGGIFVSPPIGALPSQPPAVMMGQVPNQQAYAAGQPVYQPQHQLGYPQSQGYPQQGYPIQQQGYPQQEMYPQQPTYPQQQGYPQQQQQQGYPHPGYPPQQQQQPPPFGAAISPATIAPLSKDQPQQI